MANVLPEQAPELRPLSGSGRGSRTPYSAPLEARRCPPVPGGRSTAIGYFRTSNRPRHLDLFLHIQSDYCIFMTKNGPRTPLLREATWEDPTGPASFITDSQNRPFSSVGGYINKKL